MERGKRIVERKEVVGEGKAGPEAAAAFGAEGWIVVCAPASARRRDMPMHRLFSRALRKGMVFFMVPFFIEVPFLIIGLVCGMFQFLAFAVFCLFCAVGGLAMAVLGLADEIDSADGSCSLWDGFAREGGDGRGPAAFW